MPLLVGVRVLACRITVYVTVSYQACKKKCLSGRKTWEGNRSYLCPKWLSASATSPLLGAKWPQKCTPWWHQRGAEKLRSAVLTCPLPCVAGDIWHLLLKLLFQTGGCFLTGKYEGTWYQGLGLFYILIPCNMHKSVMLWTMEVRSRVGVQMAMEELSVFRWSALNFFGASTSRCFLSPHDLPLSFSCWLV